MKYKPKTKPMDHQKKALRKMLSVRRGALFMGCGTGKTKVAIDFCCALHRAGVVNKVLVVAPKLATIEVWPEELIKHAPPNNIEWRIHTFEYLGGREMDDGRVYDHGYQEIEEWEPDCVIIDEAHKIKNPTSKRNKALYHLAQLSSFGIAMTGTPIAKSPLDLFGVFKVIQPSVFGTTISHFKRRYVVYGGYHNYEIIRFINLKELRSKIKPYVYQKRTEDCMDLPPVTEIERYFELDENRKLYNKMKNKKVVEVDGKTITAPIPITRALKQSQITSGFIFDEEKDCHYLPVSEKAESLQELLEELYQDEVSHPVIFANFIPELKLINHRAKAVGYKTYGIHGGTKDFKKVLKNWRSKGGALIVQTSTGAESIDLTAAQYGIFFAHPASYITYEQACRRFNRKGQEKPMFFYHILGKNTTDEITWMALGKKEDTADLILRHPELMRDY